MAQATQDFTIPLSKEIIERIEQAASRRHQSAAEVVAEILNISLPPLSRRTKPPLRTYVKKIENLSLEEIKRKAESWLPEEAQQRLSDLLQENKERELTEAEAAEVDALLNRVQSNAIESAAAKWVLKNTTTTW